MISRLFNLVLYTFCFCALAPLFTLLCFLAWAFYHFYIKSHDAYAIEYFEGLVRFDEVIAGRSDSSIFLGDNRCVFSIVELSSDAPELPEAPDNELNWTGQRTGWETTPVPSLKELGYRYGKPDDALAWCYYSMPSAAAKKMLAAATENDSYFVRFGPRGEFKVYSKPQGIAGFVTIVP